jgi:hypothetical protein
MADATIPQRTTCLYCDLVVHARGFCRSHYNHMAKYGKLPLSRNMTGKTLAERISLMSEHDNETGCRLWVRGKNGTGYGNLIFGGKSLLAHRAAYELAYGPLADGMKVCHRCDTPACVNPDHLFAGSHQANSDDKLSKGREARGVSHGMHRLTEVEIRKIRVDSRTQEEIAADYGINRSNVSMIKARKRWAHII